MKRIIFITYCCKTKARLPEDYKVSPAKLYMSSRIHTFIDYCDTRDYCWAIFSDKYGLVFKTDKIGWYDKAPDRVTPLEYNDLLLSTIHRLHSFDAVFFYYCDESFHPLYKHLVDDLKGYKEVKLFSSWGELDAAN